MHLFVHLRLHSLQNIKRKTGKLI